MFSVLFCQGWGEAPSGPGTRPAVPHPSYVLAVSRDAGAASGLRVTFPPVFGCTWFSGFNTISSGVLKI